MSKLCVSEKRNIPFYRVSHSKVILLCWGYRFWFFLIIWTLRVYEIGPFMPNSSVFMFLMLRALYGSIDQHLLCLWILNYFDFFGLFQAIKSDKPSKIYFNLKVENKKHQKTNKKRWFFFEFLETSLHNGPQMVCNINSLKTVKKASKKPKVVIFFWK